MTFVDGHELTVKFGGLGSQMVDGGGFRDRIGYQIGGIGETLRAFIDEIKSIQPAANA